MKQIKYSKIKDNYSEEITSKVLDNIKNVGFKYSTFFGTTTSMRRSRDVPP